VNGVHRWVEAPELPGEAGLGGLCGHHAIVDCGRAAPELLRWQRHRRHESEEGGAEASARARRAGCGRPRQREAGGGDHGAGSRRSRGGGCCGRKRCGGGGGSRGSLGGGRRRRNRGEWRRRAGHARGKGGDIEAAAAGTVGSGDGCEGGRELGELRKLRPQVREVF